jgi:energy-coupling factor transporter ATP-binding protein EcfA2
LLDEPTNHLDMSSIDALAKAVNEFKGGLVLVSHDMRLISQVAKEIWICDNKTITKYQGDIMNFKMDMRAQMGIDGPGHKLLRGDASVKASDKPTPPKEVKKEPKLEVIRPVVATIPENKPAESPPVAVTKPAPTTDDATVVTVSTVASGTSVDSGDAPKKYVPPHLRKKMSQ